MKKLYSKLPKSGSNKFYGYSILTAVIFLFVHSCHFSTDGFGTSRSSSYWDDYGGLMSYTEIPARITVRSINENPAGTYGWEVLQFGCELDNKHELIADIEAAGIPKEDIQTIFYNPSAFDNLTLKPNTTYFVKLDMMANYYSFLFKPQSGFAIYSWQELTDGEAGPAIEPYPGWKLKFIIYALANWLQIGLFFAALFFVQDAQKGSREVKKFAAWLVGIFTISTLWIIYVDQPFFNNPTDYILPGIVLATSLGMIVFSFISFLKPDVPETEEIE
jgi:hypothetical protein